MFNNPNNSCFITVKFRIKVYRNCASYAAIIIKYKLWDFPRCQRYKNTLECAPTERTIQSTPHSSDLRRISVAYNYKNVQQEVSGVIYSCVQYRSRRLCFARKIIIYVCSFPVIRATTSSRRFYRQTRTKKNRKLFHNSLTTN